MTRESLLQDDWAATIERLGGATTIEALARATKAFLRPREVKSALDLLQLVLAYCLGTVGLRSTVAWAASIGLADLSNVALLGRLRNSSEWLAMLVGRLLGEAVPKPGKGRLIRLVDATTVPKYGKKNRRNNGVWRLHSGFDLPGDESDEHFSFFELTDETGSERIDRVPVVPGEIRIGDRVYMQADHIAEVIAAGADTIVRTGWRSGRWLEESGKPFDLIAALKMATAQGVLDRQVWVGRKKAAPLPLRLIALRKPPEAIAEAVRKAKRAAQKEGTRISPSTLVAAEWVILVTTLEERTFSAADVGDLYRLRWRIELAFKRLKSLIGLKGPPGEDPDVAKTWILAHLLMALLIEPHTSEFDDSPRLATAA